MKPYEWGIFLDGRFGQNECSIELDMKKSDIDAMINRTTKIELQKDRNGLLITPPPMFEWTRNIKHNHFEE
jgi:hypothetical protein